MSNWMEYVYLFPAVLIALTFHEYAHAYVAYRLGDPTAKMMGRLTLNPLKHIDLLGLLAFILFKFGWAKPVPVNPSNFRNPVRDSALVAIAGPAMNIVIAFVSYALIKWIPVGGSVGELLKWNVWINLILAVFNLIPLPPLDGWRVASIFFPRLMFDRKLETYGFIALLLLVFLGGNLLGMYLFHAVNLILGLFDLVI